MKTDQKSKRRQRILAVALTAALLTNKIPFSQLAGAAEPVNENIEYSRIFGDVTLNGNVDVFDALEILRTLVRLPSSLQDDARFRIPDDFTEAFPGVNFSRGQARLNAMSASEIDRNGDFDLRVDDALQVLRHLVRLTSDVDGVAEAELYEGDDVIEPPIDSDSDADSDADADADADADSDGDADEVLIEKAEALLESFLEGNRNFDLAEELEEEIEDLANALDEVLEARAEEGFDEDEYAELLETLQEALDALEAAITAIRADQAMLLLDGLFDAFDNESLTLVQQTTIANQLTAQLKEVAKFASYFPEEDQEEILEDLVDLRSTLQDRADEARDRSGSAAAAATIALDAAAEQADITIAAFVDAMTDVLIAEMFAADIDDLEELLEDFAADVKDLVENIDNAFLAIQSYYRVIGSVNPSGLLGLTTTLDEDEDEDLIKVIETQVGLIEDYITDIAEDEIDDLFIEINDIEFGARRTNLTSTQQGVVRDNVAEIIKFANLIPNAVDAMVALAAVRGGSANFGTPDPTAGLRSAVAWAAGDAFATTTTSGSNTSTSNVLSNSLRDVNNAMVAIGNAAIAELQAELADLVAEVLLFDDNCEIVLDNLQANCEIGMILDDINDILSEMPGGGATVTATNAAIAFVDSLLGARGTGLTLGNVTSGRIAHAHRVLNAIYEDDDRDLTPVQEDMFPVINKLYEALTGMVDSYALRVMGAAEGNINGILSGSNRNDASWTGQTIVGASFAGLTFKFANRDDTAADNFNNTFRNAAVEDMTAILSQIVIWANAQARVLEVDAAALTGINDLLADLQDFTAAPRARGNNTADNTDIWESALTSGNQATLYTARNNAIIALYNAVANAELAETGIDMASVRLLGAFRFDGATQGTTQNVTTFTEAVFNARNFALGALFAAESFVDARVTLGGATTASSAPTAVEAISLYVDATRGNLQAFSTNGATVANVLRGNTNSQNAVRDALRANWDDMSTTDKDASTDSTTGYAAAHRAWAEALVNVRLLAANFPNSTATGAITANQQHNALISALNAIRTNSLFNWDNSDTPITAAILDSGATLNGFLANIRNTANAFQGAANPPTVAQLATALTQINTLQTAIGNATIA